MDVSESFGKKLKNWILLMVVMVFFLEGTHSLKNVKAIVPYAARVHDSVTLRCEYDLEGQQLYTIKWYKGLKEFFRYVPKESPKMLIFPVVGVQVDLSRSSANEVVLIDVQPETTGKYKCEVSTDAPDFYTYMVSEYMYVIDVPEEAPLMELTKDNSRFSNKIKANCTTPPSYPAMNVSWYINGIKVKENSRRPVSLDPTRAYSRTSRVPYMTVSHMEKDIDDNIFQGGIIKVQCVSTLFSLYKSEDVRYIEDHRIQPLPSSVIGANENVAAILGPTTWSIWASIGAVVAIMMVFR